MAWQRFMAYAARLTPEKSGTLAFKASEDGAPAADSEVLPVAAVARRELGLTDEDADYLFHPVRTRAEVLDALQQLAEGADTIDEYAIFEKAVKLPS
ncbi:hypothetical protein ACWGQ5_51280 [Streptomyces sp. NPDC055722]